MKLTRRAIIQSGALALAAPALRVAADLPLVGAANAQDKTWLHGLSLFGDLKYPAGFKHYDYVNANAPRGGVARQIAIGTFDNFNMVVSGVKGTLAGGVGLIYDTLMTGALDEVSTEYGLLAEAVSHPPDHSSVTYRLRPDAKWHDGKPVTIDDVMFSLEAFKKNHPQLSAYYRHVIKAEQTGDREITFTFDQPGNRELPLIVGQLNILPKHWWDGTDQSGRKRDIAATTLEPPLGCGAYRIKDFVAGRSITFERVKDYWGNNTNVNVGQNNFDELRYEYFRDGTVAIEAFKADVVDWRTENSAKNWATAYDFPAVADKRVVLEEFPIRNVGRDAMLRPQHAARQVPGPARAARLQLCVRLRGDEQADLLRPVHARRELLRGTGARRDRPARGRGTGDPGNRARQGAARGVHRALHQSGQRQPGQGAPEPARRHAPSARSRLRGPQHQARRRQVGRAVYRRAAGRRSELRAYRAVLQTLARAARHYGQRAQHRSHAI